MPRLNLHAARCEALFVSSLQESQNPSVEQVRQAIQDEIRQHGWRSCLARMAHEFGEHPETAVVRMRWVNQTVTRIYGANAAAEQAVAVPALVA
jgi:hypothetical protein